MSGACLGLWKWFWWQRNVHREKSIKVNMSSMIGVRLQKTVTSIKMNEARINHGVVLDPKVKL